MKEERKQKLYAVLMAMAGIIFALGILFHPNEAADPNALLEPLWKPVHLALTLSLLFLVFGLQLFYVKHDNLNGFDKFVITISKISSIFSVGLMLYFESLIAPALASSPASSSLLEETGVLLGGSFGAALQLIFALLCISFILLGVVVIMKRTAHPVSGVLLFGVPLIVFAPPLPWMVGVFGGVAFGAGLAWIGIQNLKMSAK